VYGVAQAAVVALVLLVQQVLLVAVHQMPWAVQVVTELLFQSQVHL
jgi:hypothetical protein